MHYKPQHHTHKPIQKRNMVYQTVRNIYFPILQLRILAKKQTHQSGANQKMSKDISRLYLHRDLKKKIKQISADEDMPMIEVTKRLAHDCDMWEKHFKKHDKKKQFFDFKM